MSGIHGKSYEKSHNLTRVQINYLVYNLIRVHLKGIADTTKLF